MNNKRKCIITGAVGGIGKYILLRFIENDYFVVAFVHIPLKTATYSVLNLPLLSHIKFSKKQNKKWQLSSL